MTRKLLSVALVAACLSACTSVHSRQSARSTYIAQDKRLLGVVPGPPSHELADFLRMPGDRAVVVPNGVYRAGDIEAPHAATAGPYKGWLVLVAQKPGGAVVDLTNSRLWLGPDTSRVMFVGFSFVNGSVFVEGHDIDFWYTQHTFPANTWAAQSANKSAPETGYYRAPRAIYVKADTSQRVHFYGSDVHDTGSAFSIANATDLLLEGVNVWNISDLGLDPHDVVHPDAISGIGGDLTNFTIADSWIRGRIMLEDRGNDPSVGGPDVGLLFRNDWVSNSPSVGFTFTSDKTGGSRGIFGERDNVRSWGHRSGDDRTEIISGTQYHYDNTVPSRVFVADHDVSTSPPPAGALSPPAQWRLDHPYEAWPTVITGG